MPDFIKVHEPKNGVLPSSSRTGELRAAPSKCTGALVIGGSYRGLGIARSLGRRGIPVWIIRQHNDLLAGASRYVKGSILWPRSGDDLKTSVLLRAAAIHRLKDWTIFPTDDESAAFLARRHDELSQVFRLSAPRWKVLRWAYDKRLTYNLARELGIACPWTACPESADEIEWLECPFPAVLKPSYKAQINPFTVAKAWRVNDRRSLRIRYKEACEHVPPESIIVQELIPGDRGSQYSYVAIVQDGRPIAALTAKRIRQFPADFGRFSTFVETVDDPGIVEPSVRLLSALRLTGIVEIEYKQHENTGIFHLLDVNPRVWGWHTLCSRAGIDFPYLLWLLTNEAPLPKVSGKTGVRWVWTLPDLRVALGEILDSKLSFSEYLSTFRGEIEHATFVPDDWLPSIVSLPLAVFKHILRK